MEKVETSLQEKSDGQINPGEEIFCCIIRLTDACSHDRKFLGIFLFAVIIGDVFYNQPVRKKRRHSIPKRVLHSLKECLLRIALAHPSVCFKIVDIESEDDLLCTRAPSPLPPLSSGFRIRLSSLNKLNASDGLFKLSRYISGPDVFTQ